MIVGTNRVGDNVGDGGIGLGMIVAVVLGIGVSIGGAVTLGVGV